MKINIKELLFYIFLILSIILLIWNVFGDSPIEFIALVTIMFSVLLKTWSISDRQIRAEIELKNSFIKLALDFKQHIKHK